MSIRSLRLPTLALLGALWALGIPAHAAWVPSRTMLASAAPFGSPNGASADPSLSFDGRFVAFDSGATNLVATSGAGPLRNVFVNDTLLGRVTLVSAPPGGGASDGPSAFPSFAGVNGSIAFVSAADNLVVGDTNRVADIFVRDPSGNITRVSVASDGSQANGASRQPSISADGRFVAFTSSATNLVVGDTNAKDDVFVHDTRSGVTTRVSVSDTGHDGNGASSSPAISPDGRYVAFYSTASNLVPGDTNNTGDVFLRDLVAGHTIRVSVSSKGAQQNASVRAPFTELSSVSLAGRKVAFDSDATNLVPGDTNRHTDVFVRDVVAATTIRVSLGTTGVQANNDSFYSAISFDGREVAFQSLADNVTSDTSPGTNVYVRDLSLDTTSAYDVSSSGSRRDPETVAQLLRPPAIAGNGQVAAFSSTAANLVAGVDNGTENVFTRSLAAPRGILVHAPSSTFPGRATATLRADDPHATRTLCIFDRTLRMLCPLGRFRLPRLAVGHHRVTFSVGGPGMLFDPHPLSASFFVRHLPYNHVAPLVRIDSPRSSPTPLRVLTVIRGRAHSERNGVRVVLLEIASSNANFSRCSWYDGRRFVPGSCARPRRAAATGTTNWVLRLRTQPTGVIAIVAIAVDNAGLHSAKAFSFVIRGHL